MSDPGERTVVSLEMFFVMYEERKTNKMQQLDVCKSDVWLTVHRAPTNRT